MTFLEYVDSLLARNRVPVPLIEEVFGRCTIPDCPFCTGERIDLTLTPADVLALKNGSCILDSLGGRKR
jgi:hypothetical protein